MTIPPMTDPLSVYWEQPDRESILVDESIAVMSKETFAMLKNYSSSIPTGTYVGKMWKAKSRDGKWYLRWYDKDEDPQYLSIPTREIILCQ
jgi:hypothetical protein